MSKQSGRKVTLWDASGTPAMVAGGREHGITINNELIDITSKDSSGWRELLDDVGVRSVDVSFSGLMDGDALIAVSTGPTSAMLKDYEIRIETVGVFAGSFGLNGIEIGSPHDNAAEVSGTLMSSGPITWTPT